ncbi:SET (Su(var)3-9, Enhancer-of-zeste, Trithorax) domain [Pleosporales sp. CAS-2024a]
MNLDKSTNSSTCPSIHTASTSRPSSSSSAPPTSPLDSSIPPGAPLSPLFHIRQTPTAGRAVFATRNLPEDTLIWRSTDLTLEVLLREYRREVCGQCFGYEYGRDLHMQDRTVGFAFCSAACQDQWRREQGEVGVAAWTAVEALVKGRSKEDSDMVDSHLPRPNAKAIQAAWAAADVQAALIRTARGGDGATKKHRKALSRALLAPINPDILSFCLSGLLWHHRSPSQWPALVALADNQTPYHSDDDLAAFTRAYLHLLAVVPCDLLPVTTADKLFMLSSRDSFNSFGIRSLEDDGSEFFGYGCWPAASYFNHSCAPNVEKKRQGRVWEFRLGREVTKGEELCITYLSGEERKLSRGKRMMTLKRNWGFECGCERCEAVL